MYNAPPYSLSYSHYRWNLIDNKLATELNAHEDAAQVAMFDPFGRLLVTAGSDGAFKIWTTR